MWSGTARLDELARDCPQPAVWPGVTVCSSLSLSLCVCATAKMDKTGRATPSLTLQEAREIPPSCRPVPVCNVASDPPQPPGGGDTPLPLPSQVRLTCLLPGAPRPRSPPAQGPDLRGHSEQSLSSPPGTRGTSRGQGTCCDLQGRS